MASSTQLELVDYATGINLADETYTVDNTSGFIELKLSNPNYHGYGTWFEYVQNSGSDWCRVDYWEDMGTYVGLIITWNDNDTTAYRTAEFIFYQVVGDIPQCMFTIKQKNMQVTITMTGDNKLATRGEFNSQIRKGYYSTDINKAITGEEINNMTWTDGDYNYKVTLNSNYSGGRCAICGDITCTH